MKTKAKTSKTKAKPRIETSETEVLDPTVIAQELGGYFWVIGPYYDDDTLQVLGPFTSRLLAKGWRDSPDAMCQLWDDEQHGKLMMFWVSREHYERVLGEHAPHEAMASAPSTAALH